MIKCLSSRSGFTLLELIVVMAVIAILVAIAVPNYVGYAKDAKVTAMQIDAGLLEQSAIQYVLINDDGWPVGDTYEPADEVLSIMDDILLSKGLSISASELVAHDLFREIDGQALSVYIRSTSAPIDAYFIVDSVDDLPGYSGELEGMVFSKETYENRAGVLWSGLYKTKT